VVRLEPAAEGGPLRLAMVIEKPGGGALSEGLHQGSLPYVDPSQAMVRVMDLDSGQERDLFRLPWVPNWQVTPDPQCAGPTPTAVSLESYNWCPTVVAPSAEELAQASALDCFSWSPDGRWLSFVSPYGELFLVEASGASDPLALYRAPGELYAYLGVGPGTYVHGEVTCAAWLAADRLAFLGLTGGLPKEVPSGTRVLPADTTFLAELREGRWEITAQVERPLWNLRLSPDGAKAVYYEIDPLGAPSLFVTEPFSALEQVEGRKLDLGEWHPGGRAYFFSPDGEKLIVPTMSEGKPGLTVIDLNSLASESFDGRLASWGVSEYPGWADSLFWPEQGAVGEAAPFALGFIGQEGGKLYLGIGDLETGRLTRYPIDLGGWRPSQFPPPLAFLAWLP
jgi:hypothetical protein